MAYTLTTCLHCMVDWANVVMLSRKHREIEMSLSFMFLRWQEILFGRDLDNQPREEDFLSLRTYDITSSEKALICASLQASTVTLRCAAAGLQSAEELLQERDTER